MMLELRAGCSLGARARPGTGLVDQMMGNGPNMPGLLQKQGKDRPVAHSVGTFFEHSTLTTVTSKLLLQA